MRISICVLIFVGASCFLEINGLEHYDKFREGPCIESTGGGWSRPTTTLQNVDLKWVDTLHYNAAGSKYHMYKMASANAHFSVMTKSEFHSDFCYTRNTTSTADVSAGFGFGGILDTWDVTTGPGYYVEQTPRNKLPRWDPLRQQVVFTDNKSFAFLLDCWKGSDNRAWNVVSNTPRLSAEAKRMIEAHAISLGFSKNNFVFLNYDNCRAPTPKGSAAFLQIPTGGRKGPLKRLVLPVSPSQRNSAGSGWSHEDH